MNHQSIPREEDLPILLSWIHKSDDPLAQCEHTKKCGLVAHYRIDWYEDIAYGKRLLWQYPQRIAADKLWQKTVSEQMGNRYTIYGSEYLCLTHLLPTLKVFLNTPYEDDLRALLQLVYQKGQYSLVSCHRLSAPDDGLIMPMLGNTVEDFLENWRKPVEVRHQVQSDS